MIDPFGRHISYLRVSVTDRCDFRCVYCMAEDMTFLPKAEVLSLEELERLCSVFVRRGVKKLRLTGGEPLVRKNVMSLFRGLGRHLDSGALEPVLEGWWPRFPGPFLYYPGRRLVPAPLRALVSFIRTQAGP